MMAGGAHFMFDIERPAKRLPLKRSKGEIDGDDILAPLRHNNSQVNVLQAARDGVEMRVSDDGVEYIRVEEKLSDGKGGRAQHCPHMMDGQRGGRARAQRLRNCLCLWKRRDRGKCG